MRTKPIRIWGAAAALGLIFSLAGPSAIAGTYTWTGASNSDWSTTNNWLNHAAPGNADIALFPSTFYTNQPTIDVPHSVGGLWLTGAGSVNIGNTNELTLYGATIRGKPETGLEIDASAGSLVINAGIYLAGTIDWYNYSNIPLTINGNIYGGALNLSGSGMLVSTNINPITGDLTVNGGTLQVTAANNTFANSGLGATSAGRSVTISSGGVISINAPGGNAFGDGGSKPGFAFVINAGAQLVNSYSGAANNTAGPITLNGGTLTTAQGYSAQYQSWELGSTITVGGTAASYINSSVPAYNTSTGSSNYNGLNLGIKSSAGYQTVFSVGVTGVSGPDLTVSAPLVNAGATGDPGNATGLIKTGPGNMALTASNGYTGPTTIGGGTLQIGNFGATGSLSGGTGGSTIIDNGMLAFARTDTVTQGADFSTAGITGSGGLAQSARSNLILNVANPYIGPTLISGGGTITISALGNIGIGSPTTFNGGVLALTATTGLSDDGRNWTFGSNGGTVALAGGASTLSGPVIGPGVLTVASPSANPSVVILSNTANFQAGTRLVNALLPISSEGQLGAAPSSPAVNIWLYNGQLAKTGGQVSLNANRGVQVGGMGYVGSSSGALTINGGVTDGSGFGGLGVVWDGGTILLNGPTLYSGATVIGTTGNGTYYNQGVCTATLQLGLSGSLPTNGYFNFGVHPNQPGNQAILDIGGHNVALGGLSSDGANAVVENSGGASTLTINGSGGPFAGVLSNVLSGLDLVVSTSGAQGIGVGSSLNSLQVNSGVLNLNGNGNINVGQFNGSGGTISSAMVGTPVLVINNSVPSTFSGVIVNGAGGTPGLDVASGMLTLPNGISSGGPIMVGTSISSGTLVLGAGTSTVGGLFTGGLSPSSAIVNGTPSGSTTLIVNYYSAALAVFTGRIGGSGNQNNIALNMAGNGQVVLTGSNTYTGATTVKCGTLSIAGQLINSTVTVSPNGTVAGVGDGVTTGVIRGNVITAGSGSAVGLAAGSGTLTVNGSVSLSATNTSGIGGASQLIYVPGTTGVEMLSAGTVAVNGGGYAIMKFPDSTSLGNNFLPVGTYTLIKAGTINAGNNRFVLDSQARTSKIVVSKLLNYALNQTGTLLTLTVSGHSAPPVAYLGCQTTNAGNSGIPTWNDIDTSIPGAVFVNWTTDSEGNFLALMLPGPTTDVVLYSNDGSNPPTSTLGGGSWIINSLNTNQFNLGHTITNDGSTLMILAGSSNLGNPSGTGISVAGSGSLAINIPLIVGASQVWSTSGGGALTVNGISGTAGAGSQQTLTLANVGTAGITVNGAISDGLNGGSLALSMSSVGAGVTTLSSSSSYSGGTTLWTGKLALGDPQALGSGGVTVNGGQLDLQGKSAFMLALNGTGGTVTNNGAIAALNVSSGTYGGMLSDGTAVGSFCLVKTGGGVQVLSGNNTYTGPTTVNGGKLIVDGSIISSATVNIGGKLGGTGSLSSVTVNAGGQLAPGDSPGKLILSGTLSLLSGAEMDYELGTILNSDKVRMPTGALELFGQQFSDFNFTPLPGFGQGSYTLIDAGSITGTLGGGTSGTINGLPASLAIQGNDLVLTVVPEPGTLVLLAASFVAISGFARRRTFCRTKQGNYRHPL